MRTFAWFLALMAVALASIGLLAYPAWLLLHPHFNFAFHRIGTRIGMLTLLAGFLVLAPRLGLSDRRSLGYGAPRPRFIRELLLGLGIGTGTMLLVVGLMIALGLLGWNAKAGPGGSALGASWLAGLVLGRLVSGLAVGFIEETFMRGAMLTGIQREVGAVPAVLLTSIVYSATHFFASYHVAPDQVTAASGRDLLVGTLHLFAQPAGIADAYLCLAAVGIVLGCVRVITGNIAAGIGLHAGWVWVMLVTRGITTPVRDRPLSFLLSQFDGFVGWLVLAWTVVLGVALLRFYAARTRLSALTHPSDG